MVVLKVPAMKCEGCAASIEKAVKGVDAGARVTADLATKIVSVDTAADADKIAQAVKAAGYDNDIERR